MLICRECGKTIANTNPRVHYGICSTCPIPVVTKVGAEPYPKYDEEKKEYTYPNKKKKTQEDNNE